MHSFNVFFLILLTIHAKCILSGDNNDDVRHRQYCIVGAGPSGLQMGYFLKRAERDYVIFEQNNISGSFFVDYPRHRKLISINKRHTGKTNKEFNFRHDWNSLISDDESLLMRHYSKDFFPPADTYVKYLNDYANKLQLNIQYRTRVSNIRKQTVDDGQVFLMEDQHGSTYSCQIMIMAIGISTPNNPEFHGMEHTATYENISLDTNDFEGKSVMIFGRGNSAFETADHILGSTNVIHMMARSRIKMAWETHYVGDLRAINNGLLDTYQLKSLDGIIEADVNEVAVIKNAINGKMVVTVRNDLDPELQNYTTVNDTMFDHLLNFMPDNFPLRDGYDYIIRCLGFVYDFTIFNSSDKPEATPNGKFPLINAAYKVDNVQDMFVAGTSAHSLDHRKSAGGFIHGYRYTAQALHHLLEFRYQGVRWPSVRQPISELINHIVKRANEGSGIYQMFSQLGDVIILHKDGLEYEYLEEFPLQLLNRLSEFSGRKAASVIVLSMEYGVDYSGAGNDVFRPNRATGEPSRAHHSNFLHPVLYYYRSLPTKFLMKQAKLTKATLPLPHRIHHIVEDFLTDFSAPISHILPLRRFLENCIGRDLRYFFDDYCFKSVLMYREVPLTCKLYYLQGQGLPGTNSLMSHKKRLCGDEMQC